MRVLLYFNNRYLYGDELCHLHYYHIILTNTNGVCALQLFNDAGQHIDDISEPPNPYTPPSNYCYIRPFIDTDYVETWMPHMIEFLEHHNIISTLAPADQKPYYCEIIRDTKTGDRLPHMLQGFLYSELVRVNDPAEWTAEIYPFTRRIEPHCPTTPEHGGLGFHADGRPVQVDRHLWLSMQTIDPPKRLLSRSERYLNHYTERMKVLYQLSCALICCIRKHAGKPVKKR